MGIDSPVATKKFDMKEFIKKISRPRALRKTSLVGRNEMCPCGSKVKFKHCCGSALGVRKKHVPSAAVETNSAFTGGRP